jgi:hypothetical protein
VHVRRLTEDNKEDKELVDVAPGWGQTMYILCYGFFVHYGYFIVHIFLV